MENINVESKSREFISILNAHLQGKVNLSRLKLIAMFVIALCKVQFKIFIPRKNKEIKALWLFNSLKRGEFLHYRPIVRMGTQLCYISGCKMKCKENGANDFLIIVSFNKPEQAQINYNERWQIETCFRAMKTSGFDIEKTHLQDIERIEKLTLIVMIAFVWCYKTGIFIHENMRKIKIKKHGRKAQSIFKCGLSYIANVLLNFKNQDAINVFSFLSCT
jgi:transposase